MSRSLDDLDPLVRARAQRVVAFADSRGADVMIYCTHRTAAEQARLYRVARSTTRILSKADELRALGRGDLADLLISVGPQHGPERLTNAGPGQSAHNYRLAFDAVPLRDGKPVWEARAPWEIQLWTIYGESVRAAGLDWAGDWETFREFPHAQARGFDWRAMIKDWRFE